MTLYAPRERHGKENPDHVSIWCPGYDCRVHPEVCKWHREAKDKRCKGCERMKEVTK